jgi:hypothetical protein
MQEPESKQQLLLSSTLQPWCRWTTTALDGVTCSLLFCKERLITWPVHSAFSAWKRKSWRRLLINASGSLTCRDDLTVILSTALNLRTKHVPSEVHLSQWIWKYLWPASRRSHRIPHREVRLVGSRVSHFEEFLTNSEHIIQFSHVITAILHTPIKGSPILRL